MSEERQIYFDAPLRNSILERLRERVPDLNRCPLCRVGTWVVASGAVFLVLQDDTGAIRERGPGLANAALVCSNCGNTHLINLRVLGLYDLVNVNEAS